MEKTDKIEDSPAFKLLLKEQIDEVPKKEPILSKIKEFVRRKPQKMEKEEEKIITPSLPMEETIESIAMMPKTGLELFKRMKFIEDELKQLKKKVCKNEYGEFKIEITVYSRDMFEKLFNESQELWDNCGIKLTPNTQASKVIDEISEPVKY